MQVFEAGAPLARSDPHYEFFADVRLRHITGLGHFTPLGVSKMNWHRRKPPRLGSLPRPVYSSTWTITITR